jgi:hypothetical protein
VIDEASIRTYRRVETVQGGSNVVIKRHAFRKDLGSDIEDMFLKLVGDLRDPESGRAREEIQVMTGHRCRPITR